MYPRKSTPFVSGVWPVPSKGVGVLGMAIDYRIVEGATYVYEADLPPGCKGGHYKAVRFIKDVPSYQTKVLVECLSGKDRGLWFTCTPANFAQRYKPLCPCGGEECRSPALHE